MIEVMEVPANRSRTLSTLIASPIPLSPRVRVARPGMWCNPASGDGPAALQ
jgi:hypothetical protein